MAYNDKALVLRSIGRGFNSYWTKLPNNLGQVVNTYVPLSPSSITWYRSKDGEVLRLERWPQAWWKAWQPTTGLLKKSSAGWLSVHRDQLWAQRSVTSMGELCLFRCITVFKGHRSAYASMAPRLAMVEGQALHGCNCISCSAGAVLAVIIQTSLRLSTALMTWWQPHKLPCTQTTRRNVTWRPWAVASVCCDAIQFSWVPVHVRMRVLFVFRDDSIVVYGHSWSEQFNDHGRFGIYISPPQYWVAGWATASIHWIKFWVILTTC